MKFDAPFVFQQMLRSRFFEEAVTQLWHDGLISGEMHSSIGEEAIAAGTVLQLESGDALALDHRPTAAMVMRGLDLTALLLEFLGHEDGLCSGNGGHMHLFSDEFLAASSGIVGASAPTAAGFALAARYLRPGNIALSFFGEGAMNQGMLLETLNLSKVWKLPLIYVCKDSKWAITTISESVTSGDLTERVKSFGIPVFQLNGTNAQTVWEAAREAIQQARTGGGPVFIYATCTRREGHLLGDPLHRTVRHPLREMMKLAAPLLKSISRKKGTSLRDRLSSIKKVTATLGQTLRDQKFDRSDPLAIAERQVDPASFDISAVRKETAHEVEGIVQAALTKLSEKLEVTL